MSPEMPKFSSDKGLGEEEAKKATRRLKAELLESERKNALAEAERDIREGLTKEGAEAVDHAIDILRGAEFSDDEILNFIKKQTEENLDLRKSNNNLH
ncbi:MAG: hypothetical protein US71_C0007G0004 [Parcubacteria group bacterium GW2011_GWD2_38_12]|nr:MAG: hypothetical protein US06_C0008G0042 [Parcubacteria group bacterium GW2011_GWC2_36_17]KKQ39364.1 MAG: hypothetical protein US56_C0019G0004 [Candidatus Moranbacteria bacterium GW2011_GWF2_37_7]KKQ42441.1 MAG: hypothetical protein US61_C0026G0015 [Parcubacteria group bacterium GW2011_GWE2_37_8]KKQ51870.1 MAG: hypothetical protein US71_C0007G0004 [Parcubacteria group bacterium GW2011_GWD2_38_12]KKQ58031.1 MAG: hypothetical protein US78_C0026G0006 [Parcubacteria group bacterium GW2011_GWD1_